MPDVGKVLRDCHIPWPAANQDELRDAAMTWTGLATAIRDNYQQANRACVSIVSGNEGAAVDEFEKYWQKFGGSKGALPLAAEACDTMANACTQYADEVAEAKHKLEEAGAEIGATIAVGTVGAIFTFGVAEGAADGIAAGVLYTAERVAIALGDAAAELANRLSAGVVAEAIAAAASAVGTRVSTEGAVNALGAGIVLAGNGAIAGFTGGILAASTENAVRELFAEAPLSPGRAGLDLVEGAGAGAAGGPLGKLADLGRPQLAALLRNASKGVIGFDAQLSAQMVELANQVEGTAGKVSSEILTKAATQLITAQQVNADKLTESEIEKLLKRAITKGHDQG